MDALKLSADRKVSPVSRWEDGAQRWKPTVRNAFGLPGGREGSCGDAATDTCHAVCYAQRTERQYTSVGRLVTHNYRTLLESKDMAATLSAMVEDFLADCDKADAKRSQPVARVFRIHWDGELFSADYAAAWGEVCARYPEVTFWLYTRAFAHATELPTLPNLTVYLSVDADNVEWAKVYVTLYPDLHVAMMGATFSDAQEAMVTLTGKRAPKCPENSGKVPLVNDAGEGACVTCGLCVYGRQNVLFSTTKR